MQTDYNRYFGEVKPQKYALENNTVVINTNIRSEVVEGVTVWYATSTILRDGDSMYDTLKQNMELQAIVQEQDALSVGIIEGTIDTTTKARLYARLIHDGKKEYPKEIPDAIVQEVYNQYTNYYHYQPPLTPPNEE